MKFDKALTEGSFRDSEVRDVISSFALQAKRIDPMNPEFKEKFKSVKYDYKGSKADPEYWKHYKKHLMPKDTEQNSWLKYVRYYYNTPK